MSRNAIVLLITDPRMSYLYYTVNTIKYYCKRYDIDLRIISNRKYFKYHPVFEKWQVKDYIKEYSRVLMMDTDIVIKRDSPNIFDLFQNDNVIYAVSENVEWSESWGRIDFINIEDNFGKVPKHFYKKLYFNSGVISYTYKHLKIFDDDFIIKHNQKHRYHDWGEQTLLNYIIAKQNYTINYIDSKWNSPRIWGRASWENNGLIKDDITRLLSSYFIHYLGLSNEERVRLIKRDFLELKEDPFYYMNLSICSQ
jgi:lipopolysaccharide biosynthesis glycosyltransferase